MVECDCGHYEMFECADCAACTNCNSEYYMVTDQVWLASGLGLDDGMLCIGCLEARRGKLLTARDFIDAPINDIGRTVGSLRYKARLAF